MSASPFFYAVGGAVDLIDASASPDEILEAALTYFDAKEAADEDFHQGRTDHHEKTSAAAAVAAYNLLTITGIRFNSLDEFEAFLIRGQRAAEAMRRAEITQSLNDADTFYRNNPRTEATN